MTSASASASASGSVTGYIPNPIQLLVIEYIHLHPPSPYTPTPSQQVMANLTVSIHHPINTLTPLVEYITSLNPSGLNPTRNHTKSNNPTHGMQMDFKSMKMVISLDMNMMLHLIHSFHTCTPPPNLFHFHSLKLNHSQTSNPNININTGQFHLVTRPIHSLL
jgi:hypothetical protein